MPSQIIILQWRCREGKGASKAKRSIYKWYSYTIRFIVTPNIMNLVSFWRIILQRFKQMGSSSRARNARSEVSLRSARKLFMRGGAKLTVVEFHFTL